jgi:hypothetical protein
MKIVILTISILLAFAHVTAGKTNYQEKTFSADSLTKIIITNPIGRIRVLGSDTSDVRVKYAISTDADSSTAKRYINSAKLTENPAGNILHLKTILPQNENIFHYPSDDAMISTSQVFLQDTMMTFTNDPEKGVGFWVDYEIYLDKNTHLEINSIIGEVYINNIRGNINVINTNQKIYLSDITGDISISDFYGGAELRNIWSDLDVKSSSGDIELSFYLGNSLNMQTNSGKMQISLDFVRSGKYIFNAVNGDILLNLPEKTRAELSAESTAGKIFVDNVHVDNFLNLRIGKFENEAAAIQCITSDGTIWINAGENSLEFLEREKGEYRSDDSFSIIEGKTLKISNVRIGILDDRHVKIDDDETVHGAIIVVGSQLRLSGKVHGNVYVIGGKVTVDSTAQIHGDVLLINATPAISDSANIHGEIITQQLDSLEKVIVEEVISQRKFSENGDQLQGSYIQKIHRFSF